MGESMNKLHDTSKYSVVYDNGIKLYAPVDPSGYHVSRFIEIQNQRIYAKMGCTSETLGAAIDQILEYCNSDKPVTSFRTDVGVLCNQIKYRMQFPLDHDLSIRLGALLCFMEDENPDEAKSVWLDKKLHMASENPELYSFFLLMGVSQYKGLIELPDISSIEEYLRQRQEAIQSLKPLSNK